jgi:hypothetical protein
MKENVTGGKRIRALPLYKPYRIIKEGDSLFIIGSFDGENIDYYNPLGIEISEIANDFKEFDFYDNNSVLKIVNKYGLPGRPTGNCISFSSWADAVDAFSFYKEEGALDGLQRSGFRTFLEYNHILNSGQQEEYICAEEENTDYEYNGIFRQKMEDVKHDLYKIKFDIEEFCKISEYDRSLEFHAGSIIDWKEVMKVFKEMDMEEEGGGKIIWKRLSDICRDRIRKCEANKVNEDVKASIIDGLNKILNSEEFYRECRKRFYGVYSSVIEDYDLRIFNRQFIDGCFSNGIYKSWAANFEDIESKLNHYIKNISFKVTLEDSEIAESYSFENFYQAIGIHFYYLLRNKGYKIGKCLVCGKYFKITKHGQKYCPKSEYDARSHCKGKYEQKAYKARREKGIPLSEEHALRKKAKRSDAE